MLFHFLLNLRFHTKQLSFLTIDLYMEPSLKMVGVLEPTPQAKWTELAFILSVFGCIALPLVSV